MAMSHGLEVPVLVRQPDCRLLSAHEHLLCHFFRRFPSIPSSSNDGTTRLFASLPRISVLNDTQPAATPLLPLRAGLRIDQRSIMGTSCHGSRSAAFHAHAFEMTTKPSNTQKAPVRQPATVSSALFPLFTQLPPELRLKVWKLNLPTTRLVPMSCGAKSPSLHDAQLCTTSKSFMGCTSNASVPVNLHVCAESRADALKRFQRAFGFARMPGHIFFNPASDILYFGPQEGYMAADAQFHTFMSMCEPLQLALVRRIAISDALFWVEESYNSMTAASLTVGVMRQLSLRMPALEQIIFVPREQDEATIPVLAEERMMQQIQMAIRTVRQQMPFWQPPPWEIVSLRTLSAACG